MADAFTISSDQLANMGFPPDQIAKMQSGTFNFGQSNPVGGAGGAAAGLGAGFGANIGTGQLALGGLSALGNLWTAWNATDLAKKQFNFNKQLSSSNFMNQEQTYNTNLADRESSRAAMENLSPAAANAYVSANSLKTII